MPAAAGILNGAPLANLGGDNPGPADLNRTAQAVMSTLGVVPPFLLDEDAAAALADCLIWAIDTLVNDATLSTHILEPAFAFLRDITFENVRQHALQMLEVVSMRWPGQSLRPLAESFEAFSGELAGSAAQGERLRRRIAASNVDPTITEHPARPEPDPTPARVDDEALPLLTADDKLTAGPSSVGTASPAPDPGPPAVVLGTADARAAATHLLSLVDHAPADHREENRALLAQLSAAESDLGETEWVRISIIAGIYARHLDASGLSHDERLALWAAARWAVHCESQRTPPKNAGQRFGQLVSFLTGMEIGGAIDLLTSAETEFAALIAAGKQKALNEFIAGFAERPEPAVRKLVEVAENQLAGSAKAADAAPARSRPEPMRPTTGRVAVDMLVEVINAHIGREQAVELLERVWDFLDGRREDENRRRLTDGRNGSFPALATLAVVAARNAAWRLANPERFRQHHGVTAANVGDFERLAVFAGRHGALDLLSGIELATEIHAVFLTSSGSIGPAGYADIIEGVVLGQPALRGRLVAGALQEAIRAVGHAPQGGDLATGDVTDWVTQVVRWSDAVDRAQLRSFLSVVENSGMTETMDLLALREKVQSSTEADAPNTEILSPEDQRAFDEHYRRGHVNQIVDLLGRYRDRLLTTLTSNLAARGFDEYRKPQRKVRIQHGAVDRFPEFRDKATRGDLREAQEAREAFDRALSNEKRDVSRDILREWRIYAAMQADSVLLAMPEWVEAFASRVASPNEVWNLGVFHASQGEYDKALSFLRPGVASLKAPHDHLMFASYLAVQVLRDEGAVEDHEQALEFLFDNARILLDPVAQLLWVAISQQRQPRPSLVELTAAIKAYRELLARPVQMPSPAPGSSKNREEQLDRLRVELVNLGAVRAWRLWLNDFLPRNEGWSRAWDWMATACEQTDDINEAVAVLRRAAQLGLRDYKRPKGNTDTERNQFRERRIRFLRQTLVRLCSLARRNGRENLLREIYETFVREVPELMARETPANRPLHDHLREFLRAAPPEPPDSAPVWPSLHEPMVRVQTIEQFTPEIQRRVEAALSLVPGRSGRGANLTDALMRAVGAVGALRDEGISVSAGEIPARIVDLTDALERHQNQITAQELPQLRPLISLLIRVVESFTRTMGSMPEPTVRVAPGWVGFPDDVEQGALVLDIGFGGPSNLRNLVVWGTWRDEQAADATAAGEPPDQASVIAQVRANTVETITVPMFQPDHGNAVTLIAMISLRYDWGLARDVRRTIEIAVPVANFSAFLAERGIQTQEFPDPFAVDRPLTRDEIGSPIFQGRAREIALIKESYGRGAFPPAPLCFFGIRRTGKTSLMRRIALEVEAAGYRPVEVSVTGLRASSMTFMQTTLGLLKKILDASRQQYPQVQIKWSVPNEHPNPTALVDAFFPALADAHSAAKPLVILLDEFQLLVHESAEPLLDALRPIYEAGVVGFVMFANQGHDLMIGTGSQLALTSRRVDFLSAEETGQLVREPLEWLGIRVSASAASWIFDYTGGHPNFTGKLLKGILENLNLQHRNIVTSTDVHSAAKQLLSSSAGMFNVSWFSGQNLSEDEQDTAIRFAKADLQGTGLTPQEARAHNFSDPVLRDLEQKLVLKVADGRIGLHGRLLAEYLRERIGLLVPPQPAPGRFGHNVGLFVDLENLLPHRPDGMDGEVLGRRLLEFAARFGQVKCAWTAVAPWNVPDWYRLKLEIERSGLFIDEVPAALRRGGTSKANLADMQLNDQINEEVDDKALAVIVLGTGDKDYYAIIQKYLDRGIAVHLLGGQGSIAQVYSELADTRRRLAYAQGRTEPDFTVTQLDQVFEG